MEFPQNFYMSVMFLRGGVLINRDSCFLLLGLFGELCQIEHFQTEAGLPCRQISGFQAASGILRHFRAFTSTFRVTISNDLP